MIQIYNLMNLIATAIVFIMLLVGTLYIIWKMVNRSIS